MRIASQMKEEVVLLSSDAIRGEIYGDERRTQIVERELDDSSPEDFIKKEEVVVNISSKGFAKRLAAEEYKAQNRGGKGTIGAKLVDDGFRREV